MEAGAVLQLMQPAAPAAFIGGAAATEILRRRHPEVVPPEPGDIDLFHPSMEAMMFNVSYLLGMGAVPLDEQEDRKIQRWLHWGAGDWETNSVRLEFRGAEFNLVFKLQGRKPLRTIVEQISSFDFSGVSMGWETKSGRYYDLFDLYWKGEDEKKIRLNPDRERQWLTGSIGKHTGMRQAGRYAKYVLKYEPYGHLGYDLVLCKRPLVQGYLIGAEYYADKDSDELSALSDLYRGFANLIESDDIEGILAVYEQENPYDRIRSLAGAL